MSEFPAVPLVLDRKAAVKVHLVVGPQRAQVNFLGEVIGLGHDVQFRDVTSIDDSQVLEALQTKDLVVFHLPGQGRIDIAQDTRNKIGIWSAQPIRRRTAGVRVLVRQAAGFLGMKGLDPERLDVVGDAITDTPGENATPEALIWEAAWHLTDLTSGEPGAAWIHPWADPWAWGRGSFPMSMRLQVLYKDLAGYVFAKDDDWKCAQTLGITPSRFAWLKSLHLSPKKVEAAFILLSAWRTWSDPKEAPRVALQIGAVFAGR